MISSSKQRFTLFILTMALFSVASAQPLVQETITKTLQDYRQLEPKQPFSDLIEFMQLGCNKEGEATIGIAYRQIESFKPITGVVIVERQPDGFLLRSATFPDIKKIKNGKNRRQVEAIVKPVQNIPFDPHSGKRAVNTVSSATRYGAKALNYFNYMARRVALEIEKHNQSL
tara:strand:+ start:9742 stop:10257 length:516 start_codon:yes stop_codon:yes gene_type:complete